MEETTHRTRQMVLFTEITWRLTILILILERIFLWINRLSIMLLLVDLLKNIKDIHRKSTWEWLLNWKRIRKSTRRRKEFTRNRGWMFSRCWRTTKNTIRLRKSMSIYIWSRKIKSWPLLNLFKIANLKSIFLYILVVF